MANNFEYKIHISIDEKGLKDSVKNELANMAKEFKNNAYKIELTGDPKDLIKQLSDLKKLVPNLDLTKGLHFELAEMLKGDAEQGKKIIDELTTYIINSVSDAVTSIDEINDSIKRTEENLEKLKARKANLLSDNGATDAVAAFEKAEKRFNAASTKYQNAKQDKGKFAAAEDMKQPYQDMLNFQQEANKQISANVNAMVNDTGKSFHNADGELVTLKEHLQDIKVDSSYQKEIQNIEQQILSTENRLSGLKKDLESAKNPEVKVKGKFADTFISDLQSQLDEMTGIEVKVKPKIDKDVKLEVEVEGDVKPTVQSNEKVELPKPTEKIDLGKYDLSKIEVVNEKLSEYKSEAESISESAQKAVDELNKFTGKSYTLDRNMFDIPSTLKAWNKASMSANDFKREIKAAIEANEKEKAAILYENLKTYYPKTSATLDTFKNKDFKDNYDSYLSRGKIKERELQFNPDLQRYRVLEDAIHELEIKQGGLVRETAKANAELEKQAKISSELSKYNISTKDSRNSAIQSLDQQIAQKEAEMERMLELDKNFQSDYHKLANARVDHESTEEYSQILEKYNIPKGSGLLQSVQYLASQRGELQDTIDILKGVRQAIVETNEAVSTPPNTSGMDEVEQELHEEAAAHRANEEAAKADAKAQEEFNSQEAEQRVAEFKEKVGNLTFPDKRPGDNILDNFIVYIKKGTMEVDEAVQRIKDSFGALEKSQQDVQSQNPKQGFVEYVKKSDYEIYESAVEMAKNREKVLEELAQREIDIANKVEGETKNAYVRMGNKTWILNQQDLEDGDYRIDDKITSTKNLIDELGAQIEDEKDPKILSSLNEQLDAAKIKLIALTEAFPKSAKNTRLSASDALSFGSEVIDEYARTQRERYQVGESNFNIVQEEKEYWDILTKEIKTEDDLTRAIERQKEVLVDLSKKRDEADEKLRNMSYDDPNYKKAEKEWDDASGIYYDEKMKLYNLRQLKSNWGKGVDQAPVVNASFLDSEWRESDKYLFGIDEEIEQIIEAEQREAEQARKTAEEERKLNEAENEVAQTSNETSVSSDVTEQKISQLEREFEAREKNIQATNEQAEAERALSGSSTNQQPVISTQTEQQAQSTADSITHVAEATAKVKQEMADTSNPMLDSIEADAEEAEQEVNDVGDALRKLAEEKELSGGVDISSRTHFGKDKDGNDISSTTYSVKGNGFSGRIGENGNVIEQNINVSKGYTEQLNAYKQSYSELNDKVKEYINLRKETAKSGKLDKEVADIQRLEKEIVEMTLALRDNPLFNQSFEDKALGGLEKIEGEVQNIRFDKIISNYKEFASLNVEKQGLINKGVPEDSIYIKYLNQRISAIQQETEALRELGYTEEQNEAIEEAQVAAYQKINKQQEVNSATAKKYQQTLDSTRASIQKQAATLAANGKLMKAYGDQVNGYMEEINNPNTSLERLRQIQTELNKISANAIAAGKSGKTFFQIFQQRGKSLLAYLSTFASFYRIVGYVKQSINTIKELDTELVDLRKTTTMTTTELNEFYDSSANIAKQLGVTSKEIISQAAAWSRLGYSSKEAATQMAQLSSKFATVSPGMTTEQSTDYLVSTMQAYGIAVDDVERKVMDNVNRIGKFLPKHMVTYGAILIA